MLRTLFLMVTLLFLQSNTYAQTFLDSTFGTNGFTITTIPNSTGTTSSIMRRVVQQPDGKFVAAGSGMGVMLVSRFSTDGTLDNTFNGNGLFSLPVTVSNNTVAYALILLPNDKILVAGYTAPFIGTPDDLVIRLNTNGTLDSSFGVNGIADVNIASQDDAYAMALQPDGKIVIVGDSGYNLWSAARLNSDGSIDTTFANGGTFKVILGSDGGDARGVAVLPNGNILLGGYNWNDSATAQQSDFVLLQLTSAGKIDSSFNQIGTVYVDVCGYDMVRDMKLQTDGKILLCGYSCNDVSLLRLNIDGTVDTAFNHTGYLLTDFDSSYDRANSIATQPDGKIVVGGYATIGGKQDMGLCRYNSDGSLDSSFGINGKIATGIGTGSDGIEGITLQSDGKVVAVGSSEYSHPYDKMAIARFLPQGSTGISSVPSLAGISIYPNPANTVLHITNSSAFAITTAAIISADGRIVKQVTGTCKNVPVADVADGFYFLKISGLHTAPLTYPVLIHH